MAGSGSRGLPSVPPLLLQLQPAVLKTALKAVAELMACGSIGVLAASKGVLDGPAVSALSKIVYNIFLPALLMTSVTATTMSQPIGTLLPLPVMAWCQILLGLGLAQITTRLVRLDRRSADGKEAVINSAFGNSGILPLLFATAIFRGHPDPTVLTRCVAYVSFFLIGWSPTFWTLGQSILTRKEGDPEGGGEGGEGTSSLAKKPLLERMKSKTIAAGSTVKSILSPPIISCLVGLFLGLCKPIQRLLIGETAPLAFVWNAFLVLAAAYTPSGVLVLAGSLANGPKDNLVSKAMAKKLFCVAVSRWLFMPPLTAGLLWAGRRAALIPNDPVLLFVVMLQSCMPSAQNSVIILQVAGMKEAAGRMARTLCVVYLLGILPISAILTVVLQALKLM